LIDLGLIASWSQVLHRYRGALSYTAVHIIYRSFWTAHITKLARSRVRSCETGWSYLSSPRLSSDACALYGTPEMPNNRSVRRHGVCSESSLSLMLLWLLLLLGLFAGHVAADLSSGKLYCTPVCSYYSFDRPIDRSFRSFFIQPSCEAVQTWSWLGWPMGWVGSSSVKYELLPNSTGKYYFQSRILFNIHQVCMSNIII